MDILNKAKELGNMIADTEEMRELLKADVLFKQSDRAKKLFKEYGEIQKQIIIDKDNNGEELKKMLEEKQKEINSHDISREYIEKKSNFDNLMKKINDVIVFTISGEEGCSCKGGCGSCGGCKQF